MVIANINVSSAVVDCQPESFLLHRLLYSFAVAGVSGGSRTPLAVFGETTVLNARRAVSKASRRESTSYATKTGARLVALFVVIRPEEEGRGRSTIDDVGLAHALGCGSCGRRRSGGLGNETELRLFLPDTTGACRTRRRLKLFLAPIELHFKHN